MPSKKQPGSSSGNLDLIPADILEVEVLPLIETLDDDNDKSLFMDMQNRTNQLSIDCNQGAGICVVLVQSRSVLRGALWAGACLYDVGVFACAV